MKILKPKYLLILMVSAIIIWMLKDSFLQPGTKDLAGNFKELAFYRNENNTGPVIRIYAVSVADTLYEEMMAYGNLQPHTKYGTTRVYFFKNNYPFPKQVSGNQPPFDADFNKYCVGFYEKNGMGNIYFSKTMNQ